MIKSKVTFNEKYLSKGLKLHFRYEMKSIYFVKYFGIFLLVIFIFSLLTIDKFESGYFYLLFIALFLTFLQNIIFFSTIRNIKKNPVYNKEIQWEFSNEKFLGQGEGFNFVKTWELFYKAIITSEGILLYPQKSIFYWVQFDSLVEESSNEELINLIKSKINNTKVIK